MRPTPVGWRFLGLIGITLAAALASGNNLLYLLYGVMLAALAVSAAALRLSLRGLALEPLFPEGVAVGAPFILRLRIRNRGAFAARSLNVILEGAGFQVFELAPGQETEGILTAALPQRGRNLLSTLRVESDHPFGLLRARLPAPESAGLAVPRGRGVGGGRGGGDEAGEGDEGFRRGGGDEILGVRPYDPSDGFRRIHWKATARLGSPYVAEYADDRGRRVTVRVEAAAAGLEAAVEAAAAACRRHIQAGAEVRLLTPEGDVAYGLGPGHLRELLRALALLGEGKLPRAAPPAPPVLAPPFPEPLGPTQLVAAHAGFFLIAASLFLIEEAQPAVLAVLLAALAAGAWLDFRGGKRLPKACWTAASAAMLAYSVLLGWRVHGVILANTYLVAYLLAHQSLNAKTPAAMRQSLVIGFLGFFLVSGQTISLSYFPFLLVFTPVYAHWARLATGGAALGRRALAALTAACFAAAGLAFTATPRLDPLKRMNPFVAMGLDTRAPKGEFTTGFNENVSLGFFGSIRKSSARVMRVRLPDWNARTAPLPYLRLRGSAFDRFDGRSWRKDSLDFPYRVGERSYFSDRGKAWVPRRGNRFFFPGSEGPKGRIFEFTLYPLNTSVIFTCLGLRVLELPDTAAYFDYTDTVYAGAPYVGGITYLAAGNPEGEGDAFFDRMPGYERLLSSRFLQLPPKLDPRISALAEQVTKGARDPREKALKIERYLRRAYAYSLYSEEPNSTLQDFFFKTRRGNCEHFATAAAVLLRASGVPSRVVTGFLVDEWNEFGRFYDVRQSQAHAWAEAYIQGVGWVTVEGTPTSGESLVSSRLRRYFAALQTSWYRNVIGYDRFMQKNTFYRFRFSFDPGNLGRLFVSPSAKVKGAAVVALFLAGAVLWALRRRRDAGTGRTPTSFERAAALLARRGLERAPAQTPREYAAAATSRRPELAALPELAELHYRARLRPGGLEPALAKEAERLLADLRNALKNTRP